jgi:hypothetical protein
MSFASRLKMGSTGMLLSFVFYTLVGIIFLVLLPLTTYPLHLGILGIFNLIIAYGLFMRRNWTVWFVLIVFVTATTFSIYTLYYFMFKDPILGISMIAYLILTWVSTVYTVSKRKTLET